MQLIDGKPVYAATDLVGFLACTHLTDLERAALGGLVKKPMRSDPERELIAERGKIHERLYLDGLRLDGRTIVSLEEERPETEGRAAFYRRKAAETRTAIRRGDDVIFQACFFDGTWLGFADFLLRVADSDTPLGWSYEVADTKLAHRVKASALIQICVYNEMLAVIQGRYPERMHVALGGKDKQTQHFRTADYRAYFRALRARFLEVASAPLPQDPAEYPPPPPSYPEPVEHCGVCPWDEVCSARRRADDHLSLVAGIGARTRTELAERGTGTRRGLARLELPVVPRLARTSPEALRRVREQARIQVQGEDEGKIRHELLELLTLDDGTLDGTKGLLALPPPSPGDLFLDLEGDPFAGDDGMDYLFGILEPGKVDAEGQPLFHAIWGRDEHGQVTAAGEKLAFERTIDTIFECLAGDPDLHVYHYASYEPTHLGKLMGRYNTRQERVDQLFRGDRLIDLYQVVRQGLRASVESYSLKRLEPLYAFERSVELRDAGSSIVEFEHWLQLGGRTGVGEDVLAKIQAYNRDDVLSTWKLRDWLEERRSEIERARGGQLPRPELQSGEAKENLAAWLEEVRETEEALVAGLPEDVEAWDVSHHGRWLLAQLLQWHRREDKPGYWRYFHLLELSDEERLEEPEPLAMLELIGPEDAERRTFRYRFPPQEHEIGERGGVDPTSGREFPVEDLDEERAEIVLRFKENWPLQHPRSLVPKLVVETKAQKDSLLRIGKAIAADRLAEEGPNRAARDLLARRPPHVVGHAYGAELRPSGQPVDEAAHDLVGRLDRSYLAIQGPPGSGKTWTGARMILELVLEGKRVGVGANSHKVIGKLLDDVAAAAGSDARFAHRPLRIGQKPGQDKEPTCAWASKLDSNAEARAALDEHEVDVVGGTAWLWANEKLAGSVDVLFIDEAGQFSLANAVAVSPAAANLVLLGDPQQLDQPTQGTHPPGAGRSALAHLLADRSTMPGNLGLFMDRTWRLHPDICVFTSETFYEGQLEPQVDNVRQGLSGVPPLDGTGVRYLTVDHVADRDDTDSPAEADVVAEIVDRLSRPARPGPTRTECRA